MKRGFTGFIAVAIAIIGLSWASPAYAQDTPTFEIGGGWNFLRISDDELDDDEKTIPKGWYAEVGGNLTPVFGLVLQYTDNYKTFEDDEDFGGDDVNVNLRTIAGGARVTARASNFAPFAEFLAGWADTTAEAPGGFEDSQSDGMIMVGGGVTMMASVNFGVRVLVDYLHVFSEDEGGGDAFRFAVGGVVGFGRR